MNHRVTGAQFMALWEATGLDRMPYPLRYRSTALTDTSHDFEQRRLRSWMAQCPNPALSSCIDALRYPDLSVTVYAPHAGETPAIRRRGCVRGDLAVLADQVPADVEFGDIYIAKSNDNSVRNIERLALGLVGGLPDCAAGTVGALSAHPDDVEPRLVESNSLLRSTLESKSDRLRRLLKRPRSGAGYICIRGPRNGLAEPLVQELTWIDVADDGRYLYRVAHDVHLSPISPVQLYEEILRRLAVLAR